MQRKNNLLILALLFFSFYGAAQESEAILRKRTYTQKDTSLISAYLELAKYYYVTTGKGDSLVHYAKKSLKKAQQLGDKRNEITSLTYIGVGNLVNGNTKLAEEQWFLALNLAKKSKDLEALASIHNKLGALFSNTEQPKKSIAHLIESAKYSEKIGDFDQLAMAYYGIATVYITLDQPEKQMIYIHKALRTAESKKIKDNNREIIYNAAAQHFFGNSDDNEAFLDSSEIYANKGLQLVEKNNWNHHKPSYLNALSSIFYKRGEFDKSLKLGLEALEILKTVDREDTKFSVNHMMAQVYSKKNNKQLAYMYLQSLSRSPLVAEDNYKKSLAKVSYEIYQHFGDFQLSLQALEKKVELDNKLYESDKAKIINELETKYQSELKDANIVKLNQQKKIDTFEIEKKESQIVWLFGLVSLILMVLTIIIFVFRQRSAKSKLQILETEQRLNRARMNPHFFFNALTSIQTLTLKEKDLESTMYLSKFSKLMRQSLDSTYHEMNSIEDEIEFIGHYIELQKLRHPELFEYSITCDEKLDLSEVMIPGMIIQPFIENSIEHGFKGMVSGGELKMEFTKIDDSLLISLTDNGHESKEAQPKESNHVSRAISIITDRLFLLKKKTRKDASFEVLHNDGEMGYQIKLTLPLLFQ